MDGGVFPVVLQVVLEPLCKHLSLPQRKHLRWFVFGVLMSVSSSRLKHVAAVAPRGGHRTSCGNFLRSNWDSVNSMQLRALETVRWMKPKAGESIYLIIDDTRIEQRGQQMEAVSKLIGGSHYAYTVKGDQLDPNIEAISSQEQDKAVDCLLNSFFVTGV